MGSQHHFVMVSMPGRTRYKIQNVTGRTRFCHFAVLPITTDGTNAQLSMLFLLLPSSETCVKQNKEHAVDQFIVGLYSCLYMVAAVCNSVHVVMVVVIKLCWC